MIRFLILVGLCLQLLLALSEPPSVSGSYTESRIIDLTHTGMINPVHIAADDTYICITDDFTNTLYICDYDGDVLQKINQLNGIAWNPCVVALDPEYIYCSDRLNGNLHKISRQYFDSSIITCNDQVIDILEPRGLAFQRGDLYIADTKSNRILKINLLGLLEWQTGRFGYTPETLNNPLDIAVDNHSLVYVADGTGVKIFDQDNSFQGVLVTGNNIPGLGYRENIIAVANLDMQTVALYQDQKLLTTISSFEKYPLNPQDVCLTYRKLLILDAVTKHLYLYEIK